MNLDDRIRAAARRLDAPADLASSVPAYWRVEESYRAEMATATSAATLHRRAIGVESYLRAEEAAREGHTEDATAMFATAAGYGIGDPADLNHEREGDALDATAAAARAGGRLAVELLLQEIRPFVRALCTAVVSASESPEDRARVICLAVVAALPEYNRQIPFLEFVHGIALRLLDADPTNPVDHEFITGTRATLSEMLGRLPDKQRDVLVLRVLLGLSAERTAEILRSTPGAVRVTQHQALARLRAELRQPDVDELPHTRSWRSSRRSDV
jgi:RNA polymerase sigma-70 factor, ECF subfamily